MLLLNLNHVVLCRHKTDTRLESLCRVLELPAPPRLCLQKKKATQQQGKEEGGISSDATRDRVNGDHPEEIDIIDTCEGGQLTKVSILTTGTFKNGRVLVSSLASPTAALTQSPTDLDHDSTEQTETGEFTLESSK